MQWGQRYRRLFTLLYRFRYRIMQVFCWILLKFRQFSDLIAKAFWWVYVPPTRLGNTLVENLAFVVSFCWIQMAISSQFIVLETDVTTKPCSLPVFTTISFTPPHRRMSAFSEPWQRLQYVGKVEDLGILCSCLICSWLYTWRTCVESWLRLPIILLIRLHAN